MAVRDADGSVEIAAPVRVAAPWIAGRAVEPGGWTEFVDPYRLEPVSRVALSSPSVVADAVAAAVEAQARVAAMSIAERAAVLRRAADLIEGRVDELAATITRQIGKALKNTRREVGRSPWTLRAAATAIESLEGAVAPTTVASGGGGLVALVWRVPVGVVGAVTPFNAPFNLVAHKLAPAFAAGNAVVLKPASQTALTALDFVAIMEEAGAPAGAFNVVPGDRSTVHALATDQRIAVFTLTGGRAAGEAVARDAGTRKVLLELGGNSPNIVHEDADIELAARDCAAGGFANTGQSCNSVQRIYVHASIADRFTDALVAEARRLRVGDPLDPGIDVGTLVNADAAARVESWLGEAVASGARILVGGDRVGASISPTVVVGAREEARIVCEEVFGPVVVVLPYEDLDEAIARANASPYGLQAAIFTSSLAAAFAAATKLQAGGVLVNRSTNFRLDHLPYGGVKDSGVGREGPAYAIEELSERKLVLVDPDPAHRPS
jgi:acyl-CoA reductase-like NAD-dependent aldehyde dehydrogenase